MAALELHAFLGKSDFFLGEVEGGADLWDVGQEEEGAYADWERDYAVDYEEPVIPTSEWLLEHINRS